MYIRKHNRYEDPDQYDSLKATSDKNTLREVMNDKVKLSEKHRGNVILKEHIIKGQRYDE